MNGPLLMSTVLAAGSLVCGLLSVRRRALAWSSGMLAVLAAGLGLYAGVGLDMLAAGAAVLALPLLLGKRSAGGTDA